MSRLVWGAFGERYYETGVDRGVLYLPGQSGVAWNGLTSVRESSSGGDPVPYFIDGFKYIQVASPEDFGATIEAFSAPPEFAACDGNKQVAFGLFVTQQRKSSFGFSYRTLIGSDLQGRSAGYKLHLVYGAMAQASEKNNSSVAETTDPQRLSWSISTKPEKFLGYRPTAHLVIDSRTTPKGVMDLIETMLYGDVNNNPYLPDPQEVIDTFSLPGNVFKRNLATYGPPEPFGDAVLSTVTDESGQVWTEMYVTAQNHVAMIPLGPSFERFTPGSMVYAKLLVQNIPEANGADDVAQVGVSVASRGLQTKNLFSSPEWFDIAVAIPPGALLVNKQLWIQILQPNNKIRFRMALVDTQPLGEYFDGSFPKADGVTYGWEGTPGASVSTAAKWD